MDKRMKSLIIVVIVMVVLFIFRPFTIINSGNRGLRFTMGKLNNTVLNEGINFKLPIIQTIKEITIRPLQMDYQISVGDDGAITKDNQNIGATLTLFYKYMPSELVSLWRNTGLEKMESINQKTMNEAFKQEIGRYTIFEVAPIQEDIRKNIFTRLKTVLALYPIEYTELRVTNYDWPDSFEKQIEETMSKTQQVKQKQQDLLITEQEAQKQVKQAEASKTSMITLAEGEKESARLRAEAKALEGEGIRKYNTSVQQNMELELQLRKLAIQKIQAEKWNGQYVPTNNYGPIPIQAGDLQPR